MSLWRKEASKRLPELQSKIASPSVNSPSDLWMELHFEFDRLCREATASTDLLSRIWEYAKWSAQHEDESVQTAVVNFFFENIEDTRAYREVLPRFMSRADYLQYTGQRAPGKQRAP
jgi:hypothetical protein